MFSRQGKTTAAAMALLYGRKPSAGTTAPSRRTLQPEELLRLIQDTDFEQNKAKPQPRPSASFRNVSRSRLEHLERDRTDAPGFDIYNPNYTVVQPRVKSTPRYGLPTSTPRKERILVPRCLDDLQQTYPRHQRTSSGTRATRTFMLLDDYQQIVEQRREPLSTAQPSPRRAHLVTSFKKQLSREAPKELSHVEAGATGISPKDNPSLSSNHHSPCVPFARQTQRKALWNPQPPPEYSPDKEAVTPRLSTTVLSFHQVTPRKPLTLRHMLTNPPPADLPDLERGWKLVRRREQSMPPMESVTPRDDLMYRTLEMYTLNVPVRQPLV